MKIIISLRKLALPAILLLAQGDAQGKCSRPIQVPISAIGFSVIIKGQQVCGVYPEVLQNMAGCQFVFAPMPQLPWRESGAYISRQAVSLADQTQLQRLLLASVESGEVWKKFLKYYPVKVLEGSIRPLSAQ